MQNKKQVPEPIIYVPAKYEYKKSCYADIFQVLQSFRKDDVFCDIKLETEDGGVTLGHKVVLASASPYFHAIFTNFKENNQDIVVIKNLDSTALQLMVEFIYSGQVTVTDKNVQMLLPAADVLQLQDVKEVCCDFLQAQLNLTNCIDIFAFADLHSYTKFISSSELYIQQHFSDVVEGSKFLSLSSEQITKLIASEELKVPSEEKVFESVIRWVKHDLDSRKKLLPKLMAHVRLPLTSKDYILKHVVTEPLLNNCSECKDYVIEALQLYLLESDEIITMPHNIRTKPRQSGGSNKIILVVGGKDMGYKLLDSTEWYDPKINKWQSGPKIATPLCGGGLAVVKDRLVLYMGGNRCFDFCLSSVYVLDFSFELPNWKQTSNMLVKRRNFGVGVINSYIYAVGGHDSDGLFLKCAEVFDYRTKKWRKISSMAFGRSHVGVGVLNNLLFVVGGAISNRHLSEVECYHPGLDKWTSVSEMCVRRNSLGVGVLDGVMYAVGGHDGKEYLKSVEAFKPSTGVWTTIPDMHFRRVGAGVAVLDGLLYVIGGYNRNSYLDSVESYNPNTNTWTLITASMNVARAFAGVLVFERPWHLIKSQSKKVK